MPVVTYSEDLTLHLNGDDVYLFHPPNAHSDSDTVAYFKKANVVNMGDLYYSNNWPRIDLPSNGTMNGMIAALDQTLKVVNAVYRLDRS